MAAILTIIPYKFYPPVSGGALRCFYILREMARQHNVCVLTIQPAEEFERSHEIAFPANVRVISIYGNERYTSLLNNLPDRIADGLNYRFLRRSFFAETNTFFLEVYPALKAVLAKNNFDVIYYESLEVLGLLGRIIAAKTPSSLQLYDAHNCDSELWIKQALYEKKKVYLKYAKQALAIEKFLFMKVDAFFCCSEEDNVKLSRLNKDRIAGIVVPNGVDTSSQPFDTNEEKHRSHELIFCGSLDYFPNAEGLLWFYNEVFSHLKKMVPSVTLTVIGNLSQPEKYEYLKKDASVNFIGKVETVVPFYKRASVAIVPLKSGSGTRLKILEAMSMGNPVVSTAIGAEGIVFEKGKQILIADDAKEFAKHILFLFSNKTNFNELRKEAYEFVKLNYEWQTIGVKINGCLKNLLTKKNGD